LGKKIERDDYQELEQDMNGISILIEQIIKKFPKSTLVEQLQQADFLDPLLTKALNENGMSCISVVNKVLTLCKNNLEYETATLPPLLFKLLQPIQEGNEKSEYPLARLYRLLYKPPSNLPPSITTSNAVISPLGPFRLKCVDLALALVKLNYQLIDSALIEHRVIARCVDLFFQYKWNNILHCVVESMAKFILESKPSYMCLYLLRDCQLLDRVLQAQQNEEQERSMKEKKEQKVPHLGYMGHLYSIANAILTSSKVHSAIFYLLEDVPNRGWKKFADGKLKGINDRMNRPLGGAPPELIKKQGTFLLSMSD